jgi:hypothetical protein
MKTLKLVMAAIFAAAIVAAEAQVSVGAVLGLHGKVMRKTGLMRPTGAVEDDELFPGDLLMIPAGGKVRIVFFGSGQRVSVSGASTIKCLAKALKVVSGKPTISTEASRVARALPGFGRGAVDITRAGQTPLIELLAPIGGVFETPSMLRWNANVKPAEAEVGEAATPAFLHVQVERVGSRDEPVFVANDLPLGTTEVPMKQPLKPGLYQWMVRATGKQLDKFAQARFFVVPQEKLENLQEAERSAASAEDFLDLAAVYAYYLLPKEADRIYTILQNRFASHPEVRDALTRWNARKANSHF